MMFRVIRGLVGEDDTQDVAPVPGTSTQAPAFHSQFGSSSSPASSGFGTAGGFGGGLQITSTPSFAMSTGFGASSTPAQVTPRTSAPMLILLLPDSCPKIPASPSVEPAHPRPIASTKITAFTSIIPLLLE
jgi:hypothetical protein